MAGADLRAHLVGRVGHRAAERSDLDVVRAAQASQLRYHGTRDTELSPSSPERRADAVRKDRHPEFRLAEHAQRAEPLGKRIHHQGTSAEVDGPRSAAEQRLGRARYVRRVANTWKDRRSDGRYAFLERTPGRIPEQLVVLNQIGPAGGEQPGGFCHLAGRQAE